MMITQRIRKNATATTAGAATASTTVNGAFIGRVMVVAANTSMVVGDEVYIDGVLVGEIVSIVGTTITLTKNTKAAHAAAVTTKRKTNFAVASSAGLAAGEAITHGGQTALIDEVVDGTHLTLDRAITLTNAGAITVTNLNNATGLTPALGAIACEIFSVPRNYAVIDSYARVTLDGTTPVAGGPGILLGPMLNGVPYYTQGDFSLIKAINETDDAVELMVNYYR